MDTGDYPIGAVFEKDAPWNKTSNKGKSFDITVSQTLSKNTTLITTDYISESVQDDDGVYYEELDTTETNWKEAYKDSKMTPLELIQAFKKILEYYITDFSIPEGKKTLYNFYLKECENWIEDDFEVIND